MGRPLQDDNSRYFVNGVFSGASPAGTGGVFHCAGNANQDKRSFTGNVMPDGRGIPSTAAQGQAGNRQGMPAGNVPAYGETGGNRIPQVMNSYPPHSSFSGGRPPLPPPRQSSLYCDACRNCIYNNRKKSDGNMQIVIIALSLFAVLSVAFFATVLGIVCMITWNRGTSQAGAGTYKQGYEEYINPGSNASGQGTTEAQEPSGPVEDKGKSVVPDEAKKQPYTGEGIPENSEYYGELKDVIRTDLDYSIEWKNYEYEGNNEYTMIAVDYPQLKGKLPNRDIVNELIAAEITYFEEYYGEYSQYMMEGETFAVYSEGFVTYMDEDMVSVVFEETIYTDYWTDHGLYCINIDVENGVVLDNSSILNIDDEFAVDFRIRSREQNGSNNPLDYMTDQEIAYYLSESGTAILFYTPIGMEVGINYGEGYLTVTYGDYEQFIQKY